MPKISREESDARRTEIIDACEALYQSESYHDITMTQVAERVSFGRANVYNYFRCKDEILLALLQHEHELWAADLEKLAGTRDDEDVADGLAHSVERRVQMLKLLAMNLYDMEQNSRLDKLVEFKRAYKRAIEALKDLLRAARPQWDEERVDEFVYGFMPFLHGAYPYAFHSEKQRAAMERAGVEQAESDIRTMVRALSLQLLKA